MQTRRAVNTRSTLNDDSGQCYNCKQMLQRLPARLKAALNVSCTLSEEQKHICVVAYDTVSDIYCVEAAAVEGDASR